MSEISPLVAAARHADLQMMRTLIAGGADVDAIDRGGMSAFSHAANANSLDCVRLLIDNRATLDIPDRGGWTALHFAAQNNSGPITSLLVSSGASIDARDRHGNTPLSGAVFNCRGQEGAVTVLLRAGANPDLENNYAVSPRKLAATIANYDVLKFFV